MTSKELALDIWARRKPDSWSAGMTVKQVNYFLGLLRKERMLPPTREVQYPVYETNPPLAVVVYPNGAGFVKVEEWAMISDKGVWRLKTDAELARDRKTQYAIYNN